MVFTLSRTYRRVESGSMVFEVYLHVVLLQPTCILGSPIVNPKTLPCSTGHLSSVHTLLHLQGLWRVVTIFSYSASDASISTHNHVRITKHARSLSK